MPTIGERRNFPSGRTGVWDGRGWREEKREEPSRRVIGERKTFPSGRIGQWDGTGWKDISGEIEPSRPIPPPSLAPLTHEPSAASRVGAAIPSPAPLGGRVGASAVPKPTGEFVEPTTRESLASGAINFGAGLGENLEQMVNLASVLGQRRGLKPQESFRGRAEAITDKYSSAIRPLKKAAGVRPEAITDTPDAFLRFLGTVIDPTMLLPIAKLARTTGHLPEAAKAMTFYERAIKATQDAGTRMRLTRDLRNLLSSIAQRAPDAPKPTVVESVLRHGLMVPGKVPAATKAVQPLTTWEKMREFVDDEMIRVKKMVEDPAVKVDARSDPYQAEILMHGRLSTRLSEARDALQKIDHDLAQASKALGVDDKTMIDDVNRYLHARHAPDFNRFHGAGAAGISDAEAVATLQRIGSSKHGATVAKTADELLKLNRKTLDVLLEAEVIDQPLYDTLSKAYKFHVPLNRVLGESEDIGQLIAARPRDVVSTGIRRAFGSERQVSDITANIVTAFEQALVRAEKNRVNLATLRFARENPNLGLFREIRPKAIGLAFDKQTPLLERINDPQVLIMREAGKPVYLRIEDANLATALKGIGQHKVDGIFRILQPFTRYIGSVATRFNPEFALTNVVRDMQEAAVYAVSKGQLGVRGGLRAMSREPQSIKAVTDGLAGRNTAGAQLYRQMQLDGGTTGGLALSTRKGVELNLEHIRRLNRSAPRQAAHAVIRAVEHWNQIFEDATRLSVYRTALERGVGRAKAARFAKESTVNFNKFGRGGPQINAAYLFANASIQGTVKTLLALKNPKAAALATTSIFSSVAAISEYNDLRDPQWRSKVSKWDRSASLPIVLGSGENFTYAAFPVGWGLRPLLVAANIAYDALSGHESSASKVFTTLASALMESYNPLGGGGDIASAVSPTIADLPVEIARNRGWWGGIIYPDFSKRIPASQKYFRSLEQTAGGRATIAASQRLSKAGIEISPAAIKYAYEQLYGGAGRFVGKVSSTVGATAVGERPPLREVPAVSRFVRSVPAEQIEARLRRQRKDELIREARRRAALRD